MPPTGPSYAAFIDAGFLKSEGRKALGLAPSARVRYPKDLGSFLRAYWYGGAYDSGDPRYGPRRSHFDAVAATPRIRVRLGI